MEDGKNVVLWTGAHCKKCEVVKKIFEKEQVMNDGVKGWRWRIKTLEKDQQDFMDFQIKGIPTVSIIIDKKDRFHMAQRSMERFDLFETSIESACFKFDSENN